MAIRNSADFIRYSKKVFGPRDEKELRKRQEQHPETVGIIISPKRPKHGMVQSRKVKE